MILQVRRSLTTTGVFLSFIKSIALLFAVFLVCDLSVTVEAKSLIGTRTYKNATLLSRTMRYLTIGNQGITGEISNGPYAKLQIHTVGFNGEITIKSAKNGKYLAMDSKGKVSLAASETRDTVFIDFRMMAPPFFIYIRSKSYPTKYLDISGAGIVSGSTSTNSDSTKFGMF